MQLFIFYYVFLQAVLIKYFECIQMIFVSRYLLFDIKLSSSFKKTLESTNEIKLILLCKYVYYYSDAEAAYYVRNLTHTNIR